MIQLCGKSIVLPLKILITKMLEEGAFIEDCKKCCLKSTSRKNLIKSYRTNVFFQYVTLWRKKQFTECQTSFIPTDLCVAQLLSVTHKIHKGFDCNPPYDIKDTFLDIAKAFDKVWQEGLIFKLQSYGIGSNLLKLLGNYLKDHK